MTYAGNHEPQLPHYLYFYHLNLQIKKNHFPAKIIHHKIKTHTSQACEKKTNNYTPKTTKSHKSAISPKAKGSQ